jgi:glutathione peroxidase
MAAARNVFGIILLLAGLLAWSGQVSACAETLDFDKRRLAGDEVVKLCEAYQGKVVLIVNTASKCAYTDQYEGLERLYERYRDRGLVVIGFPSNDYGGQEPGTEKQIKTFCRLTYSVKFPMFEKTHAREDVADPLYRKLGELAGEYPRWNFHKYLLDREGRLVGSYRSSVTPEKLAGRIESLL